MDSGEISIFVILIGLVAVIVAVNFFNSWARRAAWDELAFQNGLIFEPGNYWGKSPSLSGVYRGHSLLLDTFTRRSGNSRTTYTRIVLDVNNHTELRLSISGEGVGSKLKKMLGAKEILVGDEAIDAKFFIQGNPEMAVQRLLSNTGLRQKLLDSHSLHVELTGQRIVYEKRGFEANPENLLYLFDLLGDIGMGVERIE